MKRVYIFLTMVMLALTPAMFTSCDTDDDYWAHIILLCF